MGAQLRAVRQRIRAVQSTAKITRAQELIASSRIVKAQQRVQAAAPYAREITRAVEAVFSRSSQVHHPLTSEHENPARAAVLILTSDRGFCGGYNASVLREAQGLRALLEERGLEAVPFVSGRKGIGWHRFRGREMAGEWSGFSDTPVHANASEITSVLIDAFGKPAAEGGVDEIYIVYTELVSMLTQRPVIRSRSRRRRRSRPPARCPCTNSSHRPKPFSMRCCPGMWRAGSSTRCSTRPRRRSRPGARP